MRCRVRGSPTARVEMYIFVLDIVCASARECFQLPDPMGERLNILVADDEESDRLLIKRASEHAGVEAELAFVCDGDEVIAWLSGNGPFADRGRFPYPDLLLLDIKMRRVDGFDVINWVRTGPIGQRGLPIIMLSSSKEGKDVELALELGANSYLEKPCSMGELIKMMRTLGEFWIGFNSFPSRS